MAKCVINFLFMSCLLNVALFYSIEGYAADLGYFKMHAKGWHWYDDPPVDSKSAEESPESDPVQQMSAVRTAVDKALNAAILNPTKETIGHYINLQNQVSNNASKFERAWKAALLEQPHLDFSLEHPTNNIAKQVENRETHSKENQAVSQLAKNYGLFFFYRSSCPYCQRFAPIVKDFAQTYGITVVPITTDGISLPEFPNSYQDKGQAEKFHITVEPALFAVNPYTQKAFPVAYGLISESDLKTKIFDIATRFGGSV